MNSVRGSLVVLVVFVAVVASAMGAQAAQFSDVPKYQWAWAYIQGVSDADVAMGYSDGTYKPDLVVTRDTMAVYIGRGLAGGDVYVPSGPATATFSDVPTDQWAFKFIEYCADPAQGVVQGYSDGTYKPGDPVNRDAMAVYIARAVAGGDASVPPGPSSAKFPDVPTDQWAFKYVEYCADPARGIVQGYPDGLYRPGNPVTRDQMAAYICRAFHLPMPPQPYNVTDYFPLTQRRTWFHVTPGTPGNFSSEVATGTTTISGQTYTALVDNPDGGTGYWQTAPDGLRMAESHDPTIPADTLFQPPLFLPNGLDPGDSGTETAAITINSVPSGQASFTYTLVGTETVTVPAAVFQDCLKFEVLISTPAMDEHFYEWYAKNVGAVQYDSRPFGGTDSWALASYTVPSSNPPGPPYNITDRFPLDQGDSWTYLASWESGSVTHTVSGTTTLLGQVYSNMVYPDNYTDYFQDGTDGLHVGGNQDQSQVTVFSPALVMPNGLTPGQTRTENTTVYVASVSQGTATASITFVGLDDVTVPAGDFTNCMKLEIELIRPDGTTEGHFYWWLGPGLGEAIEDETPFGDTWCLLLQSATVGGVHYP